MVSYDRYVMYLLMNVVCFQFIGLEATIVMNGYIIAILIDII